MLLLSGELYTPGVAYGLFMHGRLFYDLIPSEQYLQPYISLVLWWTAWTYHGYTHGATKSSVIIYALVFTFYLSNAMLVVHFNRVQDKASQVDRLLTLILPINGMFMYTTWVTIALQLNLAIAATYNSSLSADNWATSGLTLLLAAAIGYSVLESTTGKRYLRHMFTVYPVLIWGGAAILVAHWRGESEGSRNMVYVIVILSVTISFFLLKTVQCIK